MIWSMSQSMSIAQAAYQRAIDEMPGHEKMARIEAMLSWTRNLIARKVQAELGNGLSEQRIRLEVALRMYQADPTTVRLIREQLDRVPA